MAISRLHLCMVPVSLVCSLQVMAGITINSSAMDAHQRLIPGSCSTQPRAQICGTGITSCIRSFGDICSSDFSNRPTRIENNLPHCPVSSTFTKSDQLPDNDRTTCRQRTPQIRPACILRHWRGAAAAERSAKNESHAKSERRQDE